MFSLPTVRREWGTDHRRWLRDLHGVDSALGATLDGDLFPAARFPDGVVLSGTVIAQVTDTGLYGPYDAAATDGRNVPRGHLLSTRETAPGRPVDASVLTHGDVDRRFLPSNGGMTDAVAEALPLIRYTTSRGVI